MAWTTPRDWTAGETVTETMMDQQIKGNLEHIAGTAGFTGTPSASRGIEPSAGYFLGCSAQNWRVDAGVCSSVASTGTVITFASQWSTNPAVICQIGSTAQFDSPIRTGSVTSAAFTAYLAGAAATGERVWWIACGLDT